MFKQVNNYGLGALIWARTADCEVHRYASRVAVTGTTCQFRFKSPDGPVIWQVHILQGRDDFWVLLLGEGDKLLCAERTAPSLWKTERKESGRVYHWLKLSPIGHPTRGVYIDVETTSKEGTLWNADNKVGVYGPA